MNPLTNIRNVTKLSERELSHGDGKTSWHDEYRDSAWIFIGGLPYELTEGDVIAVFSQYGEPVNLNLVRDKVTGKSKGFAFLCYEDQRSTILAVDNLNAIKIAERTIRVDHVKDYKVPKDSDKLDDITRNLHITGCGPGVQLPGLPPPSSSSNNNGIKRPHDSDEDDYLLPDVTQGKSLGRKSDESSKKRKLEIDDKSSKSKKADRHKKKSKKEKKKKSKKSKKKSKKHKKKESSSENDSSDESSDDSTSDENDKSSKKKRR